MEWEQVECITNSLDGIWELINGRIESPKTEKIKIVQIIIIPSKIGTQDDLCALTSDGSVYSYDRHYDRWNPDSRFRRLQEELQK